MTPDRIAYSMTDADHCHFVGLAWKTIELELGYPADQTGELNRARIQANLAQADATINKRRNGYRVLPSGLTG